MGRRGQCTAAAGIGGSPRRRRSGPWPDRASRFFAGDFNRSASTATASTSIPFAAAPHHGWKEEGAGTGDARGEIKVQTGECRGGGREDETRAEGGRNGDLESIALGRKLIAAIWTE